MVRFVVPTTAAFLALLAASACAATPYWSEPPAAFTEGREVCIALYSEAGESWLVHNLPQCEQPLSPCSTFKIPNALVGLETGVISGPDDLMKWDGTLHDRKALNQDHDLASAIRDSVVWYFQQVARDVGAEKMQAELDAFDYGNRDISGGLTQFWLGSSLRISALQQVRFLRALVRQELPARATNQATVKSLLLQDYALPEGFEGRLYGKTGSCPMPAEDHGWFVGWLERDGDTLVFAVNVVGEGLWGPDARRIAIRMLQNLHQAR